MRNICHCKDCNKNDTCDSLDDKFISVFLGEITVHEYNSFVEQGCMEHSDILQEE